MLHICYFPTSLFMFPQGMLWMGALWQAAQADFAGDDPVLNMAAAVTSLSLQAAPEETEDEGKPGRGKRESKFRRGLWHMASAIGHFGKF